MKNLMSTKVQSSLMIAVLCISFAQISQAKVEDFHSMIVDSQQAKKDLSKKLQHNVDVVQNQNKERIRESKEVLADESEMVENIAVAPSKPVDIYQSNKTIKKVSAKIEKDNMKRVSQEIKDN